MNEKPLLSIGPSEHINGGYTFSLRTIIKDETKKREHMEKKNCERRLTRTHLLLWSASLGFPCLRWKWWTTRWSCGEVRYDHTSSIFLRSAFRWFCVNHHVKDSGGASAPFLLGTPRPLPQHEAPGVAQAYQANFVFFRDVVTLEVQVGIDHNACVQWTVT